MRLVAFISVLICASCMAYGEDTKPQAKTAEVNAGETFAALMQQMAGLSERQKALQSLMEKRIRDVLPTDKQSYGDFTWNCTPDSTVSGVYINIAAYDAEKKQHIWAQVHYYANMTPQELGSFTKTCQGFPAKRFPDKWVWVLVGRTEIRFGLSDTSLESDAKLDAIVKSFNLDAIKDW